jgi:hypothetical protein
VEAEAEAMMVDLFQSIVQRRELVLKERETHRERGREDEGQRA